MFTRLKLCLFLPCLLLPALALRAQDTDVNEERIVSFDSRITVNPDRTMQVRETIQVVAAGEKIRHGIYRDFPTHYRDRIGTNYSVGFDVVGVMRDGHTEPWHTSGIRGGVRVYFGDSSVEITPGPHTYVLTYNTSRQLGFFPDHDELYWNVNGVGWDFRTEHVTATVILPPPVRDAVTGTTAYTGEAGARGRDYLATHDAANNPVFSANDLPARAGLSIVVKWPKGMIAEPTPEERRSWWIADNLPVLTGLSGLAVILVYYLLAWMAVGRDPRAGVIMPLYEPPDNMSPAAMRYLKRMKFDNKVFTAALLDLAAKGYATIARGESREYSMTRKPDYPKTESRLTPDEVGLVRKLFADGETLAFRQSNHTKISAARKALQDNLKATLEKVYFVNHTAFIIPGIVFTVLTFGALVLMNAVAYGAVALFMVVWLSGWTVGVVGLLKGVAQAWKAVRAEGTLAADVTAIPVTLFAIPFVGGEILGLGMLFWSCGPVAFAIMVTALGCNALFHHLLKAPTRAGRLLLDRVDGFGMFLSAVDGRRMDTMTPPNKTPELFERFLPYALALDIEQRWAEQFSEILGAAGRPGASGSGYSPSWYSGAALGSFSAGTFASSFTSSFGSAISSASTAPGSSSGSGGGGSSGGGGGGGGGGGW